MKEDVLKFRKVCDLLIKEGGYNKNKISIESKLTWPTLKKVLEAPIEDLKITASVLGFVQDFTKKHLDAITYEGIKSLEITPEIKEKVDAAEKLSKHPYFTGEKQKPAKDPVDEKKKEPAPQIEKEIKPDPVYNPFDLLIDALKSIPPNVTINISINGANKV